jgi:opacity protein-like surface antigen
MIRARSENQLPSNRRYGVFKLLCNMRGLRMKNAMKFYGTASALLVFLFLPLGAFAEEGNLRVTVFGGGSFLKGERSFTIGGDAKRTSFANGGKFGVRGTVDLNSHWAVEGAYSFGTNNLRIFDIGTTTRERAFGTRVHQVTGNVLYYLGESRSRFRPFVTAGGGLMRFNPTSSAKTAAGIEFVDDPAAIRSDNKFEFNYGGGAEAKVSNWFGLRFDLRDHLAKIPRFGVPQVPTPRVADFFPVSGAVHDVEASAGIVIYLQH